MRLLKRIFGRLMGDDLVYAAHSRCPCGAGLAYRRGVGPHGRWDCSDILNGRAVPSGQPGSVQHTDELPFIFYEIKSENQPSAGGATTRHRQPKNLKEADQS